MSRLRSLLAPMLCLGAGSVAALGQAPWDLWFLTPLALGLALWLIARGGGGFWRAWASGFGMFGLSMAWIIEPFLVEPEATGWMAPFALILLPGGLALIWGAAVALAMRLDQGEGRARAGQRIWLAGFGILGAEWLRGFLFTGFPWAMPGHAWIDTPLSQLAALAGPLGLTALSLALAAGFATALEAVLARGRPAAVLQGAQPLLAVLALAVAGWLWGAARLAAPLPAGSGAVIRLVQPNAEQALKWHPDYAEMFFFRHLDLTAAAPLNGGPAPDLVIWSETAVPFNLESSGDGLTMAAEAAGGAPLALGIQRSEIDPQGVRRWFNSLALLDPAGAVTAIYDKHHLVPGGEYIPLVGEFANRPGWEWLRGFASQALSGYTPGPGPELLDMGPLGRALPLICYEAVFPRNLFGVERPDWIMQITNDGWFGTRSGPQQHLAQARLRAIEQGLPLLRAANTGISGVIDARGSLGESLGLGVAGFLDVALPGALPPTLYARSGDLPWHVAIPLGFLLLWGMGLRRRHRREAA